MKVLSLFILTTVANAELYASCGDKEAILLLPQRESISPHNLMASMSALRLTPSIMDRVHFDRASEPMEVMRLPLGFFQHSLTAHQLTEIILNERLVDLVKGRFSTSKLQNPRLMRNKLAQLRLKLGLLSADTIGKDMDRVMERLPTSLYEFLSPLAALASPAFKCTIVGLARLFHLSLFHSRKWSSSIQDTLETLARLAGNPGRIFTIADGIAEMAIRHPQVGPGAGMRVGRLAGEIHTLSELLRRNHQMNKSANGFDSMTGFNLPTKRLPIAVAIYDEEKRSSLTEDVFKRKNPQMNDNIGRSDQMSGYDLSARRPLISDEKKFKFARDVWTVPKRHCKHRK